MSFLSPLAIATAAAPRSLSLLDTLRSGGIFMIPLLVCSIAALAFALDRAWRMRWARLGPAEFIAAAQNAFRDGGSARALALCREADTPQSRVLAAGLLRWDEGPERVEHAVEDAGAREVRTLTGSLRPLVVIASIAPLLGLLGTVWGIILAFQQIAYRSGMGRPEALADGISQALVTTATGLVIAIPAQALYYAFRARIDRFVQRTEVAYETFVSGARSLASAPPVAVYAAVPVDVAPRASSAARDDAATRAAPATPAAHTANGAGSDAAPSASSSFATSPSDASSPQSGSTPSASVPPPPVADSNPTSAPNAPNASAEPQP